MHFPIPLVEGQLIQRYKRFFADINSDDGQRLVAHCPNTGAMTGLLNAGTRAWISKSTNPKRKLNWTLELLADADSLIGINTNLANTIVAEALDNGQIPELRDYSKIRREVTFDKSRLDFCLSNLDRRSCWVEVKSVTLRDDNNPAHHHAMAQFPDTISLRASRHLETLTKLVNLGHRAVAFFLVQRSDCTTLRAADHIDAIYARTLRQALDAGVEVLAYRCQISPRAIAVHDRISFTSP